MKTEGNTWVNPEKMETHGEQLGERKITYKKWVKFFDEFKEKTKQLIEETYKQGDEDTLESIWAMLEFFMDNDIYELSNMADEKLCKLVLDNCIEAKPSNINLGRVEWFHEEALLGTKELIETIENSDEKPEIKEYYLRKLIERLNFTIQELTKMKQRSQKLLETLKRENKNE